MKKCGKCLIEKDLVEGFYTYTRRGVTCYHSVCKPCHAIYMRDYYRRNLVKAKKNQEYADLAKKRRKLELKEYKEANPCMDCGNYYPSIVMEFDHLRDKEFALSNGFRYGSEKVRLEMEKCDLVCANCHRLRTLSRMLNH